MARDRDSPFNRMKFVGITYECTSTEEGTPEVLLGFHTV